MVKVDQGSLILVGLPIGNKEDITKRALLALTEAKIIVAEDTRVIKELLKSLQISYSDKRIFSYHDHSHENGIKGILELLEKGQDVFYVSDAGSPIISDPAYPLVRAILESKSKLGLKTIPGVSSFLTALELSGLPSSPFTFIGFLPREKSDLKKKLHLFREGMTSIFFEAPHRIEESMKVMTEKWPSGQFALCRELTKNYESVYRFKGEEWEDLRKHESFILKGEFVGLIYLPSTSNSRAKGKIDLDECQELALKILKDGGGGKKKDLAKLLASLLGEDSKEIYKTLA